jgi:hypothetical protein
MDEDRAEARKLASEAWEAWTRGDMTSAQHLVSAAWAGAEGGPRSERQVVQVVRHAVGGELARACGLACEHLSEFPDDELARAIRLALSCP